MRTVDLGYRLLQRFGLLDVTHTMVLETELDVPPDLVNSGLEFRFLSAAEVQLFAQDSTNDLEEDLADRIDHGFHQCFGAIQGDKLVSYCWFAREQIDAADNRSTEDPRSGVGFVVGSDAVFRYKGFTHPDHRGKRLYEQLSRHASVALRGEGIRYVFSSAAWNNRPALRSSYRAGYQYLGLVWLVAWRFRWLSCWQRVWGPRRALARFGCKLRPHAEPPRVPRGEAMRRQRDHRKNSVFLSPLKW